MTTQDNRATWFCIDIETNGSAPSLYDMVSLGAVPVYQGPDQKFTVGETFYIEFRPTAEKVDREALAIHGLDMERLKKEGLSREEGCRKLAEWVKESTLPGTKPVFVGHNAPFDWSFVAWYYAACGMENPFGYKGMCTKSLSAGVLNLHWFDTNKETLAELLHLKPEDKKAKHRADYDAMYQAELLIKLLEYRKD